MSIDKKKWQDIAEKYDSKAKWADALLMLNTDDHDDIISALIELDPKDLASSGGAVSAPSLSDIILNLDTSKLPDPKELFAIIDRELGRERPAK